MTYRGAGIFQNRHILSVIGQSYVPGMVREGMRERRFGSAA